MFLGSVRKGIYLCLLLLGILLTVQSCHAPRSVSPTTLLSKSVLSKLKSIPGVVLAREMPKVSHFEANFELWFEQPIDHKNPNSLTFPQRVLVGHVSGSGPVVVQLEGYEIYSGRPSEPSALLRSSQITIEHRFFNQSKPKTIPWNHLTIWQAATDHHKIINEIKDVLYPNSKFLTTGISKGGQCTMIHRSLYPDDVDASVAYVAPLNFKREDERIYHFLKTVGTSAQREQIYTFQKLCFEKKEGLSKMLENLGAEKDHTWSLGFDKVMDYYILEYSFAFWQWGNYPFSSIPDSTASTREIFDHLIGVSGLGFFEDEGVDNLRPFFWAALTEIGMYGYETAPFEEYLGTTEPFLFDFTAPEGSQPIYDPEAMERVNNFLQKRASKMMFIYGDLDTWASTRVELSPEAKGRDNHIMVHPSGHHGTRIRSFSEGTRKRIESILNNWMGLQPTP